MEEEEEIKKKCFILCLDVPEGTDIGIDYFEWKTGPNFKGIKLIPFGIHFFYYK